MFALVLYEALRDCVKKYAPTSYLEIGVREGLSLETVLKADTGRRISRLALCDNWGQDYGGTGRMSHDHIADLLSKLNYQGEVLFLDGDSKVTVPELRDGSNDEYDMILVDGDHSRIGAVTDMDNSWPLLATRGVMIVDDLCHKEHSYLADVFDLFAAADTEEREVVYREVSRYSGVGVIRKR